MFMVNVGKYTIHGSYGICLNVERQKKYETETLPLPSIPIYTAFLAAQMRSTVAITTVDG